MEKTRSGVKPWGGKQIWITFFAGMMYLLCGSVAAGNTNTVLPFFAQAKGWNMGTMILMVSIGGYASVVANLLFGQLLMRIGAKNITIIGLIGGGISALLFGLTDNPTVFYLMIVLNFVFAGAYQASAANALLAQWFPRRKGVVLGWSTMGIVIASIFWAPYIPKAFAAVGVETVFVVVAIVFWVLALLCVFFVKNTPEEAGTYPDGCPGETENVEEMVRCFAAYKSPFTICRLLKCRQTWQLMFGWGLPWLAMMAIFSQLVPRLTGLGYAPDVAALILAVSGVVALPASWLFGWLDTRIGCRKASIILAVALFMGTVMALLHPVGIGFAWASGVCFALGQGAMANLVPSMISTWFGRWDFAAASRLLFPLVNIVATFGMTLVGIFLQRGIGYSSLYIVCGVLTLVGLVIIITTREELLGKKD